jgi:hypothetical protein
MIIDEKHMPLKEASRLSNRQTGRSILLRAAVVPGMRVKLCARQDKINGQLAHSEIRRVNKQ